MFLGDRNSRLFASARASQPVICVFLFAKSQSYYFLAYYLQYEILAYNLQYANNEQKNNMTVIWNKMVDNFRTTHYWYTSCTYVVRNFKSFRLVKNSMFVMKTFQNVKNVHTIVRNILPLKNRKLTSHNCKCYIEIHIFFFKYMRFISNKMCVFRFSAGTRFARSVRTENVGPIFH